MGAITKSVTIGRLVILLFSWLSTYLLPWTGVQDPGI
jgi:hypothetical protein